jgi:hypothetical protein
MESFMNNRRNFLRLASSAAVPAAAVVSSSVARADDGNDKDFLGAWNTLHTIQPAGSPPGHFREFLSFADGGVLHETNAFLHTNSNTEGLLPNDIVNASDGVGTWQRVRNGVAKVAFRKMLFNGARVNFGDLHVTGTVTSTGTHLHGEWYIEILDPSGNTLVVFGNATSDGTPLT